MEKAKRILWLDDDPNYQGAYRGILEQKGYEVLAVAHLLEAEDALRDSEEGFDLLILDNMIPTVSESEEEAFPPYKTDRGLESGLYFYKKHKGLLAKRNTPVMVFSQRTGQEVIDEFYKEGLPFGAYQTKFALRRVADLVAKVEELMR